MPNYDVTFSLVDGYGRNHTKRFTTVAADPAGAIVNAGAFATALEAVTESRVLAHVVHVRTVVTDTATAGANKDEGVTISVRTLDNEKSNIKIPAPVNAMINPDGTVDVAYADLATFLALFTAGTWLIDDGETVAEVISGALDK